MYNSLGAATYFTEYVGRLGRHSGKSVWDAYLACIPSVKIINQVLTVETLFGDIWASKSQTRFAELGVSKHVCFCL